MKVEIRGKEFLNYFWKFFALLTLYVLMCRFSLYLQNLTGMQTQIWPAAGLALACILLWGPAVSPAIFLGTLVVHYMNGDQLFPFLGPAVGNTVEPLVGAYICSRGPSFHVRLDRTRDIARLILGAALFSTAIGTLIGLSTIWYTGYHHVDFVYAMKFWVGDSTGVLLMAPLILVFSKKNIIERFSWRNVRRWEKLVFILLFLSTILFSSLLIGPARVNLPVIIVLWAAMRLGQRGALFGSLIVAALTIWETAMGIGPFSEGPQTASDIFLLLFVASIQMTGLILASVAMERENERQELARAKEAAEAANVAKNAFLANVSHEIRTPLGVVLGFSEALSREGLSKEDRTHYVEAIKRNGSQLSMVINDILDFSKVEAGKLSIKKGVVPMEFLIADIKSVMGLEATKKGLRFLLVANEGLPASVETDSMRLRQIFANIIGNAIKFTQSGSVVVEIKSITGPSGSKKLAFIVTDTGIGISEDAAAKLFSPFTQADSSLKRKFGGTGLGLVLSRRLARALGGDVELTKSTVGQGSTFTISIDPGKAPAAPVEPPHSPATTPAAPELENKHFLVVDDSSDNQALISLFLKSAGAQVETAKDGEEALRKAKSATYDVILMDLQMPTMDGYEATKKLRGDHYQKPIIALSAFTMKGVSEGCLTQGFDAYMSKPIDKKALLNTLTRFA